MGAPVTYAVGAVVTCEDGEAGELRRLVVDSASHAVTHLVVEPRHRRHLGHLVPTSLVGSTTESVVRLRCTLAQFGALDPAEDIELRTEMHVDWETQHAQGLSAWRFGPFLTDVRISDAGLVPEPTVVTDEHLAAGEGEVALGQRVHASDGPIGHVRGLLADPSGQAVTHVLLGEGHLWGKKEVAIPISAVRFVVDDGVYLSLTRAEVGQLPPARQPDAV